MRYSNIDEIDLKILRLLQNDARISVKAIAEQIYASAPTVKARIDSLTERGIISMDGFEKYIKEYLLK